MFLGLKDYRTSVFGALMIVSMAYFQRKTNEELLRKCNICIFNINDKYVH